MIDTTERMRGQECHRPGRFRPLRFHFEHGSRFDHLIGERIDHVRLASTLWRGLRQDRDAAFGHATPGVVFGWRNF
jgi:hypothetical protein